jgi:hypothetical protein
MMVEELVEETESDKVMTSMIALERKTVGIFNRRFIRKIVGQYGNLCSEIKALNVLSVNIFLMWKRADDITIQMVRCTLVFWRRKGRFWQGH